MAVQNLPLATGVSATGQEPTLSSGGPDPCTLLAMSWISASTGRVSDTPPSLGTLILMQRDRGAEHTEEQRVWSSELPGWLPVQRALGLKSARMHDTGRKQAGHRFHHHKGVAEREGRELWVGLGGPPGGREWGDG